MELSFPLKYSLMVIGQNRIQLLVLYQLKWKLVHPSLSLSTRTSIVTGTWLSFTNMVKSNSNLYSVPRNTHLLPIVTKLWCFVCSTNITLSLMMKWRIIVLSLKVSWTMHSSICAILNRRSLIKRIWRNPNLLQMRRSVSILASLITIWEFSLFLLRHIRRRILMLLTQRRIITRRSTLRGRTSLMLSLWESWNQGRLTNTTSWWKMWSDRLLSSWRNLRWSNRESSPSLRESTWREMTVTEANTSICLD